MDNCTPLCGWVVAGIAIISHGSYPVPMKGGRANSVHVNPFVFQTYNVVVCFLLCWVVLLLGEELSYTPWGLLSGFLFNVGGSANIYAVRSIGLISSNGIVSCLSVLVSFLWGKLIFSEQFKSQNETIIAIALLLVGLPGMIYVSAPTNDQVEGGFAPTTTTTRANAGVSPHHTHSGVQLLSPSTPSSKADDGSLSLISHYSLLAAEQQQQQQQQGSEDDNTTPTGHYYVDACCDGSLRSAMSRGKDDFFPIPSLSYGETQEMISQQRALTSVLLEESCVSVTVRRRKGSKGGSAMTMRSGGREMSRRTLGYFAAVCAGVFLGSSLIPVHFACQSNHGLGYIISFTAGALIVNIFLWLLLFLFYLIRHHYSPSNAYNALPSMHFRVLWIPGAISGSLWTVATVCSVLTVHSLGKEIGFSAIQAQLLVSGLWGTFYFREVVKRVRVILWFAFALVTVVGIYFLFFDSK